MRQAKLSELIHNSEGHLNIESCKVEVHFRKIQDDPTEPEGFRVEAGSDLVVSRVAYRNGRNIYQVNGQTQTATEVTALLKGHGIDLDHNRFLILQGEVESIAQMKPKAANEHEEGLLEYLEDIIGTVDYIPQIEAAAKTMEETAEAFTEKQVRVRTAAKECEALSGEKERAESFLRQENALAELKNQKYQASIWKAHQDCQTSQTRLKQNQQKLADEREKFGSDQKQIEELEAELNEKKKVSQRQETRVKELQKNLQGFEQEDVRMQETRKHLKNKLKGLNKSQSESLKQKNELTRDLDNVTFELKGLEEQIGALQQSLTHEEGELEKICKSLQGVTGKHQASLEEKQKLLIPFNEKLRKEQQSLELSCSTRDLLTSKSESSAKELAEVEERIKEIKEELKLALEDKERLEDEAERLLRNLKTIDEEASKVEQNVGLVNKEVELVQGTLAEARESLTQSRSGGTILTSLMKEKKAGRLGGVHGRLGDLGSIDSKYDTAVSTACGFLNHIVVDTTETGQKCIEHLRKHNLGRANFIILEKMRPARKAPDDLPSGAQRLVDLVRIRDPKLHSDAFYFALGDTLVAGDIQEANKAAFGGSKRHRVVTLDGKLIETSGTISGGGRPQRGQMKLTSSRSNKAGNDDEVTPEQVEQLEACLNERRQALRQLNNRLVELESERAQCLDKQSRNEAVLLKVEHLCKHLPTELGDLEGQVLPKLKKSTQKPSKADLEQLKGAEKSIEQAQSNMARLKDEMIPIEAEIAAIQAKIMDAGGLKFKVQKSNVDNLKEQLDHLAGRSKKLQTDKVSLESKLEAIERAPSSSSAAGGKTKLSNIEAELAEVESKLEQQTLLAVQVKTDLDAAQHELDLVKDTVDELRIKLNECEKVHSKFKKIEVLEQRILLYTTNHLSSMS